MGLQYGSFLVFELKTAVLLFQQINRFEIPIPVEIFNLPAQFVPPQNCQTRNWMKYVRFLVRPLKYSVRPTLSIGLFHKMPIGIRLTD